VVLRRAQFADRDEVPMLLIEFADLILQHGEEPGLDAAPQSAKRTLSDRVRHGVGLQSVSLGARFVHFTNHKLFYNKYI
jgi:hypothetical protein